MTDDVADAHPEAGAIQGGEGPSDATGMTAEDAVSSAYDDWDRSQHGIAEGERQGVGGWLKNHADHAGTTVRAGLENLVQTAAVLRNGDQATKREMLGFLVDNYDVRAVPGDDAPPPQFDEFGDPVGQPQQPQTEDQFTATVNSFVEANPVCKDEAIAQSMINVAADMKAKGFKPDLQTMLHHALANDPRHSEQARQAEENAHVARARAAGGQISGGGSVAPRGGGSDDVGDILDELVPR